MTATEFDFKVLIAIGQYKSIYGYKPAEILVAPGVADMLTEAGRITFKGPSPKYIDMHISHSYKVQGRLAELGTTYDKLEV